MESRDREHLAPSRRLHSAIIPPGRAPRGAFSAGGHSTAAGACGLWKPLECTGRKAGRRGKKSGISAQVGIGVAIGTGPGSPVDSALAAESDSDSERLCAPERPWNGRALSSRTVGGGGLPRGNHRDAVGSTDSGSRNLYTPSESVPR